MNIRYGSSACQQLQSVIEHVCIVHKLAHHYLLCPMNQPFCSTWMEVYTTDRRHLHRKHYHILLHKITIRIYKMQYCTRTVGRQWNGFFVQEMKWGEVLFVKKWTLPPQNEMKLNQTLLFYFTFYLLGGVRTHPTHPPDYGHVYYIVVEVFNTTLNKLSSVISDIIFPNHHLTGTQLSKTKLW